MRKWRWLKFLLVLPVLFALVFTNCYIDPANVFHDYSEEIAESIVSGNATHFGGSNVNEREVKHNLIMKMPDEVGCIAVGPSLVMGVSSEMVGSDAFYNLGESWASFYDILAQFGLMEVYGKKAKRVVFCVDSFFFDNNILKFDLRYEGLKEYADYMIGILNGEKAEIPQERNLKEIETKVRQLFSVTYFQAAIDLVQTENAYVVGERWGTVKKDFNKDYYRPDASWAYGESYKNRTEEDVKNDSEVYDIERLLSRGKHIDKYNKEIFEKLIQYLLDQGAEVELFLCPLAPSLWKRIEMERAEYPILSELKAYADSIAKKYDLKMTGCYDPYELEMKDKDFYDARHVRHEALGRYFDFRAKE